MFAQRNRNTQSANVPPAGPQVPAGMAMMFKALGFDPAAFGANVESAKAACIQTVNYFDQRMNQLEATQIVIIQKQDELAQLLRDLIQCQSLKP